MTSNTITLTDAQRKNADIQTEVLQRQTLSSILHVNGVIDVPPQNMVSISAPLGGYLRQTNLLPGMHLRKGERIAMLEDPQYISLQQDYLTAKNEQVYLEHEFERQEVLNRQKATSDKVFQQARRNVESGRIHVKSLAEKLRLIGLNPENLTTEKLSRQVYLHSPIDGYVSSVNVNIGKYVTPSDILFELVNPTDIHLALDVFEKDIHQLFIGQKLVAYTNNQPNLKYPCEIILIGKNLGKERSVEVHCHFDKYDKSLIPGMFMNADIEIESTNQLVIVSDALVHYEGQDYVFYTDSSAQQQYSMVKVDVGNSENGMSQISFDPAFDPTDKQFVTHGAYTLLMAMKNVEE